ncbi:MAG TPA: glycosyltransferase family 39 protein [Thermomicrobiales bacterium]|nr:glycosyltransferase family 39 protein [Thermomicrobiales bacterium]
MLGLSAARGRATGGAGRPRRPARARHAWLQSRWAEAVLALALVAGAAAVRWPYLMRLPHFTDETDEVRWALAIWRGEILPLTAADRSYGPLHAYLLATGLWLVGPSMLLPRALALAIGALTVGATYLLGRELAGRGAGLLAAALLLTSPQHIVVNSHVAWQNATTPFYSTLCCWALARALREPAEIGAGRGGRWLVAAGFLYGLTVQTHVGTLVLAPALAAAALLALAARRAWGILRRPWPYAAVGAALPAYGPVLAYNLTHGLAGVRRVRARRDYAYETHPGWDSYHRNLGRLLGELARMLSDPFRLPARPLHYLTSPYLLAVVGLALLGLALLARGGRPLPLLALLSTAAVLPYFNHAYGVAGDRFLLTGRYVAFLLPPLLVAVAAAALALAGRALAAVPRRWRAPAAAAPLALVALLVLYPLLPLARYYREEAARDPDNAAFLAAVQTIEAERGPGTPVWLDQRLDKVDLHDGADALNILDYLLTLDRQPHRVVADPGDELRRAPPTRAPAGRGALPLIVMSRDRCWPLRDEFPLERVSDTLLLRELFRYFAVYRDDPGRPAARCRAAGQRPGD